MRNAPIYNKAVSSLDGGAQRAVDVAAGIINTAFALPCYISWPYAVLHTQIPEKENARSRNYGPFKTKNKKHDAKIAKNIFIDIVTTTDTQVMVEWSAPGMNENLTLEINRFAFEQWLYETCRLDWCLHEVNSYGRTPDKTMSADNYWLYGDYGVQYTDVVTYIIENRLPFVPCG